MADLQKKLIILPDNPLCGISTYKDTLNLATGACTRQIKKLVFNGNESGWKKSGTYADRFFIRDILTNCGSTSNPAYCSHFQQVFSNTNRPAGTFIIEEPASTNKPFNVQISSASWTPTDFTDWLKLQYANGTPVTVWYVLATPEETTISVPSGLTGTVEGYLNQDGTPTSTNPIYPTANNVEIWQHSLRKLTIATEAVDTTVQPSEFTATWTGWHDANVKEWDGSQWNE